MDNIPGPLFVVAGIAIAIYSTFIALKTDFTRFIFFFLAAAGLIAFGIIKILFMNDEKKDKRAMPPAQMPQFDRRTLDQPLPDPSYPRPGSFARAPMPVANYSPPYQPAAYQQPVYQQPAVKRYRGFYQPSGNPQPLSRFHHQVRKV